MCCQKWYFFFQIVSLEILFHLFKWVISITGLCVENCFIIYFWSMIFLSFFFKYVSCWVLINIFQQRLQYLWIRFALPSDYLSVCPPVFGRNFVNINGLPCKFYMLMMLNIACSVSNVFSIYISFTGTHKIINLCYVIW